MTDLTKILSSDQSLTLTGVAEGFDAIMLADLARGLTQSARPRPLLHITTDDMRLQAISDALAFFGRDIEVINIPAWDCLPYDRVSPKASISAERLSGLYHILEWHKRPQAERRPLVILTTINAALQKLPPRSMFEGASWSARVGDRVNEQHLMAVLQASGYQRTDQVMETGEYALRGSLIDVFPPESAHPLRLDLFGDEVDSIRTFDPLSQRSDTKIDQIRLLPVSEFLLNEDSISRFRAGYREIFGTVLDDDPLYEAVSTGRHYHGMEHLLALFHTDMETMFDYTGDALTLVDHHTDDARAERHKDIQDYYAARKENADTTSLYTTPYKPLPPERMYLTEDDWDRLTAPLAVHQISPFLAEADATTVNFGAKLGRDFAPERAQAANPDTAQKTNIYDTLRQHVITLQKAGKTVIFASYSGGARDRMGGVLADHGMKQAQMIDSWSQHQRLDKNSIGLVVLALEHGFETDDLALITETDLLGDRLIRKSKRARKADNFITEAASLAPGDLVVHINHGIGRFEGLKTIDVVGAPHDCLLLSYQGGDRLYLPVENIEMLSRFGAEGADVSLDKLGGTGWQTRHAKLKERIREMAGELIKVAANRELVAAAKAQPPEGMYAEFCARFPYPETEDQARAIDDVIADLGRGRSMDRLVCGDVGFGKTEVALRAAFIAAMNGLQVGVVVPTTLLARQHTATFRERFRGLPIRVEQLSRLITTKDANQVKDGLKSGQVDIVIGTHALLSKSVKFSQLGLLIIDEEQHFGVAHKERLKQMKADVHVLTLTATPIPRTLQLAMSGIRDLSIIASPPVDRLAVRTFVAPFDEIVIREALLREHYRGGQSFFVCPRIADIDEAAAFLKEHVPEVRFTVAHGRMTPGEIEDTMNAFYDGKYEVLLATTIIESGLDLPRVNTMIVYRADMYGLAQLYQLRGRVGRSKLRAYAYLTVPPNKRLTDTAEKRLQVLQSLDTLGAGFTLASHDMDIRGAGNLLGEEQSGHIKEVGLELYQQMLEEAVANARTGALESTEDDIWSPQINIGASVLIPERYVRDINLRMGLYRRLGDLRDKQDIEGFAAELIDRFGSLPEEVEHLLQVLSIKSDALKAGIEKIDAGPKGMTIQFRGDRFANPAGLVDYISKRAHRAKLRPDHKLVLLGSWQRVQDRLDACGALAVGLARLANSSL